MAIGGTESGSGWGLFGGNNRAGKHGAGLTGRMHDVVDRASNSASDLAHRTREGVGAKLHNLTDLIARRPLAAIAIAFGIGYLFARRRLRA
jgi:hypothetical protein